MKNYNYYFLSLKIKIIIHFMVPIESKIHDIISKWEDITNNEWLGLSLQRRVAMTTGLHPDLQLS